MKAFLIAFELRNPDDINLYPGLMDAIKRTCSSVQYAGHSGWIIKTDKLKSEDEVQDLIKGHVYNHGPTAIEFMVSDMSEELAALGPNETLSSLLTEH